jgi:iron complex outermembrane receptor protein
MHRFVVALSIRAFDHFLRSWKAVIVVSHPSHKDKYVSRVGHPAEKLVFSGEIGKKRPSGAKAQIFFAAFAAVRTKVLTYQSCPFKASSLSAACLIPSVMLLCCMAAPLSVTAQSVAPAAAGTQTPSTPAATVQNTATQNNAATTPKIPRVTTTVVVHDQVADEYLPEAVTVGNLDGVPLEQTPLSATVITRDLLSDQGARLLSDVVKNDASVGDDYVPVGYYGVYEIRGFALDLATGLQINGMTIAGEQDVPLENKESVEVLKGIAGVESGVASAGGLIDYVTKRPAMVKSADLATDQRGTAYGAVDLGHLFGSRKQVGARVNLVGEKIASYMNDTNGWRAMGAGAADWRISPKAILKGDYEYQHKVERDGSGYQLLGGTTVPDINSIYRSTMLGDQPWGPPDTYDTFNTGARLDYTLSKNWLAYAAGSYSHSLIQDNVIYAYGTPLDVNGNVACPGDPNALAYFFCPVVQSINYPGGDYGIYDYRDPNELRIDAVSEAIITGHIKTGAITQDVTGGGTFFLRSVQQPGYYTFANPSSSDGIVQDGAVYTYIGAENIYDPITPVPIESPLQSAGPRRLWEDSHQSAAIIQDRIHLPGRIQLLISGREDSLRDHNYSLAAGTPCTVSVTPGPATDPCITTYDASNNPTYFVPTLPNDTDKHIWLPQYAVTFNPVKNLMLYSNYGVVLSLGPQAPWWVDNANQFLDPFFTRQAEVGAKYEPGQRILLTTALFHMRAPFMYPQPYGGSFTFVSDGRETHDGVELNAQGKAANWLRLTASATAMNAISSDSSTLYYNNKQIINVPHLHTSMFADLTVPHIRGLHLLPGWSYTGRKEATRDDAVSVPSYYIVNFGARYTPGGEQGRVTFRLYANNITDKKYWSDTGASAGDTFIWLGAPTTVKLSAHYTF